MKLRWFGKAWQRVVSRVLAGCGLLCVWGVVGWQSTSCGVKTRLVPPPSSKSEDEAEALVSPTPGRVCDKDLGVCEEVTPTKDKEVKTSEEDASPKPKATPNETK